RRRSKAPQVQAGRCRFRSNGPGASAFLVSGTTRAVTASADTRAIEAERSMGRRLYVGNLPYKTTDEDLNELFSRAGAVDNVRVMRDQATGRARGFAFVEMV